MAHVFFQSKIRILTENGKERFEPSVLEYINVNNDYTHCIGVALAIGRMGYMKIVRAIGFCIHIEMKIRPFRMISKHTYKWCDFIWWPYQVQQLTNSFVFSRSSFYSLIKWWSGFGTIGRNLLIWKCRRGRTKICEPKDTICFLSLRIKMMLRG